MVRGGQRRRASLLELDRSAVAAAPGTPPSPAPSSGAFPWRARSGVAAAPGTPPSPAPSSGAFPWRADSGCTCAMFFYFLTCGRINIFFK